MATLDALKQQLADLDAEYASRFAGKSRITRSLDDIDSLVDRARSIVDEVAKLPKGEEAESIAESARANVELFTNERKAIAEAKEQGDDHEEFAALGTSANFVFAKYVRHFAGQPRPTRDLGLLAEMVDDLNKLATRMKALVLRTNDPNFRNDLNLVESNVKLYLSERGEIVDARNALPADQHADVLADLANSQFQVYRDHFAGKSRVTRRPQLLQRVIDNLRQIKERMELLRKNGLASDHNKNNINIVTQNIDGYQKELAEIRAARKTAKVVDLMGSLGGAANDIMQEYAANFAGKDRATRDLELLSKLADQMGEVRRQMEDLGRAEDNEMNTRNLAIVTDNLQMFESEYDEIKKAKAPTAATG